MWFLIVLIPAAVVFYLLAVATRKTYQCPECGEKITVEQLEAKRCGMCGTDLKTLRK